MEKKQRKFSHVHSKSILVVKFQKENTCTQTIVSIYEQQTDKLKT